MTTPQREPLLKRGGTSLAVKRRMAQGQTYFSGKGIDVGGGNDCLDQYAAELGFESCRNWDLADGDAQVLATVPDGAYDFLHSSHCLEHLVDPTLALENWVRVVRAGGYLVITIPDEELYEHLHWPSRYNWDHKWSFTIYRARPRLPKSINVLDLLRRMGERVEIIKVERIEAGFRYDLGEVDQTATATAECVIEIVLRKASTRTGGTPPQQTFPPLVDQTEGRYGPMLYPPQDPLVGRSLKEYGQFCQGEIDLCTEFIRPGSVVLEAGAHIGAHTVPIAQLVGPGGVVVAFEPQPTLHRILCANLVLNSIPNTLTYPMALGSREGECLLPPLEGTQPTHAIDTATNAEADQAALGEAVPMGRLDDFHLDRVDFIRLDVDGSEADVLQGATQTIQRCHPILYVKNERTERSAALIQALFDLGYRLWWHAPPLFSPRNHKGSTHDVFPGRRAINMLAIHSGMRPVEGLKPILSPEDTWQ